MTTHKENVRRIGKILKSNPALKNIRVQNGKGTSWGYVIITAHEIGAQFTTAELIALKKFGFHPGSNWEVIAYENISTFIQKYG